MKAIGLNFTKISAEKFEGKVSGIDVDIKFTDFEKKDIKILDEETLAVNFSFVVNYTKEKEESIAKINFVGTILLSVTKEESKEVLKEWKKKEVNSGVKAFLINLIIKRCTIKALDLEDQLGLPPHLPFPKAQAKSDKSD